MQLLGFIRAPGFNRLPSPGEEVVLSFLPHASVASQTIDIFYTMSIAGTLCFVESRYVRTVQNKSVRVANDPSYPKCQCSVPNPHI